MSFIRRKLSVYDHIYVGVFCFVVLLAFIRVFESALLSIGFIVLGVALYLAAIHRLVSLEGKPLIKVSESNVTIYGFFNRSHSYEIAVFKCRFIETVLGDCLVCENGKIVLLSFLDVKSRFQLFQLLRENGVLV